MHNKHKNLVGPSNWSTKPTRTAHFVQHKHISSNSNSTTQLHIVAIMPEGKRGLTFTAPELQSKFSARHIYFCTICASLICGATYLRFAYDPFCLGLQSLSANISFVHSKLSNVTPHISVSKYVYPPSSLD